MPSALLSALCPSKDTEFTSNLTQEISYGSHCIMHTADGNDECPRQVPVGLSLCNASNRITHVCSIFKKYRMAGMPDDDRDLKRGEKFYNHGLRSVSTLLQAFCNFSIYDVGFKDCSNNVGS